MRSCSPGHALLAGVTMQASFLNRREGRDALFSPANREDEENDAQILSTPLETDPALSGSADRGKRGRTRVRTAPGDVFPPSSLHTDSADSNRTACLFPVASPGGLAPSLFPRSPQLSAPPPSPSP